MSRGFFTIATGKREYYEMAEALLTSYRMHTAGPLPFAIAADEENEITAKFDKVVLIKEPTGSYMDKLNMYDCLPYDESIYIDADCLAYGDLNVWFETFRDADDFSYFGYAYDDLETEKGWFRTAGMKEYRDRIQFVPSGSSGVCYLRKTDVCREVFETAKRAAASYHEYSFAVFEDPADEPCIALGMAVCGCRPVDVDEVIAYGRDGRIRADISVPSAEKITRGRIQTGRLIHFGAPSTRRALYRFEKRKMKRLLAGDTEKLSYKLLYGKRLLYYLLLVNNIAAGARGLYRRLLRKMRKST